MQNSSVNPSGAAPQLGSLLAAAMTSHLPAAANTNPLAQVPPRPVSPPAAAAVSNRPDTAAATEFLCKLFSPGRVAVAQILPDQPGCSGSTFDLPAGRQRLHAWIEARQHKANIYYALNEPVPGDQQTGTNGRVGESDIVRIRGVAVDLDPNRDVEATPGGFDRERERLMGIANSWCEVGVHQPSAVVDSGGGVQAIWLFPEPLQATPDVRTAVKAQGKGLARFSGGDAVQSVDHLFRIPFTVNLPDRKKRARGRLRALSRSLRLSPENRADLDALAQLAPPVASVAAGDSGGMNVSGARSVLGAPEDLDPDLIERIAAARENAPHFGRLLDGALPNQDRSSRDFAIATACVEHGIGDAADIADVVAAHSPEKFEERGEAYLARTVAAALAQAKPRPSDPSAYFERIEPETLDTEQPTTKSPIAPLAWIDPTAWEGQAIPAREWEVPALIPKNEVTLVYGDGGVGKTLLMQQYAACAATGRPWLGQPTRKARVMSFLCEDDQAELHRRQNDINRAIGIGYAELTDLRIISRKNDDNLMAVWDRQTGRMKLTDVWRQVRDDAVAWGADVLILDTIADIYGGSEIDRAQVNAFVKSCLGQLAQAISGSVIALGHPSQSGKNSGEGTSGSSAWSNAARSRLFLRYPETSDRKPKTSVPTDIRELENKKLNYGPRGAVLKLRWVKGAFEPITASVPGSVDAGPEQNAVPRMEDAAENAVVAALLSANGHRLAMATNSPFYAPRVLRQIDPAGLIAFSAIEVFEALVRLETRGGIRKEEVGRDSSSRPIYGFVVVADRLSKSIAESGQEVIDGDPRIEADPVTD